MMVRLEIPCEITFYKYQYLKNGVMFDGGVYQRWLAAYRLEKVSLIFWEMGKLVGGFHYMVHVLAN